MKFEILAQKMAKTTTLLIHHLEAASPAQKCTFVLTPLLVSTEVK